MKRKLIGGTQKRSPLFGTIVDSGDVSKHESIAGVDSYQNKTVDCQDSEEELEDEQMLLDRELMKKAIQLASTSGGERGTQFPKPAVAAIIATSSGKIIGQGQSSYKQDAVWAAIEDAGIEATPLLEWNVSWTRDDNLRKNVRDSTLYVTLEPSNIRKGQAFPPITQLIELSGIPRVVIGCADPIPECSSKGAASMHSAGLEVIMGVEEEECKDLIKGYTELANGKLQTMARKFFKKFGRPLGFLHCSVVDSDNVDSFARNGNAFGKTFGGKHLSFRDVGSYELAPPPDSIWASDNEEEDDEDLMDIEIDDFFKNEDDMREENANPMMPFYEQVDAVVATFPREGHGPDGDQSVTARLNGLKWLATNGNALPANVERILVLDATDLKDLPVCNDDPNLPSGVDVEAFWRSEGRKKSRILLRSGENAQAISAANAAAEAASLAAEAAERAKAAIEAGDAEAAADAALQCQEAALAATKVLQADMQRTLELRDRLSNMGVVVEVIKGREPIDVMNHLGKRNGYNSVVWRAGCWGQRGVQAIMKGAFQWVSAHLAVDAVGGKFWQLMLAERAIQAACGPENKVKVLAEQEDFSLQYCDDEYGDCEFIVNGKPIRHIRLDCRVLVIDENRPVEYVLTKTAPMKDRLKESAPWFL